MFSIFRKRITRWYHNGKRISAEEARILRAKGETPQKKTETSNRWYIRLRLPDGRYKDYPGYTDKAATLSLAPRLIRQLEREEAGLASPEENNLLLPLDVLLDDFRKELASRGRTTKHIALTLSRIHRLFQQAGIKLLKDIRPQIVRDTLLRLNTSTETRNHYLTAIKSFSRWLWRTGRLAQDPLAGLSRWNPEPDRRVIRRALSLEELAQLIRTTETSSRTFRGLTGSDRASLYLLAAYSGLRASELASLTSAELVLHEDPPRVTVLAAYAKNRRQDTIPLPVEVAQYLQKWLRSRPIIPGPGVRLWPGTWARRAAVMIRQDLLEAGIAPESPAGRLDFHSLRVTYATLLARAGVNLQTAQALMRHADPKLTARTYTKLRLPDLSETVSLLSCLPLENGQQCASR